MSEDPVDVQQRRHLRLQQRIDLQQLIDAVESNAAGAVSSYYYPRLAVPVGGPRHRLLLAQAEDFKRRAEEA